jgi:hypothetical protein
MVQNCLECSKLGVVTECQYMEFPVGVHHYFSEKACTFHFWLLQVFPKRSWEEYLKFAKAEGASIGYVLTFPPDEVIRAATTKAAQGEGGDSAPPVAVVDKAESSSPGETSETASP